MSAKLLMTQVVVLVAATLLAISSASGQPKKALDLAGAKEVIGTIESIWGHYNRELEIMEQRSLLPTPHRGLAMLTAETRKKNEVILRLIAESKRAQQRIETAPTPALAEQYRREAIQKAEAAGRMWYQVALPAQRSEFTRIFQQIPSIYQGQLPSLTQQFGDHNTRRLEAANSRNPEKVIQTAAQNYIPFAGAGGISLHKSAEFQPPLDKDAVRGAVWDKDRLYLHYKGRRVAFPALAADYLAMAMRSIQGNEGVIRGELIADEPQAVAIQAGKELGELLWKKEFLPSPWVAVPEKQKVELTLGPALGISMSPEPSTNRVTYYGPLLNTRLGQTLVEADGVLVTLMDGVDFHTGRVISPPGIDGFMSLTERRARRILNPPKGEVLRTQPAREEGWRWWHTSIWYVWVPDRMTLALTPDGNAFTFVESKMRLSVWSLDENGVSKESQELGEHTTRNYAELAKTFPVLKELEEAAKAAAVARYLKANNVPIDLAWTKSLKLSAAKTPSRVPSFSVTLIFDGAKPWIDKETKK